MVNLNRFLAIGLVALGFIQTLGFIFDNPILRGIGMASTASPLPLVFTQFRGYETFAPSYEFEVIFENGDKTKFPLTSKLYSQLGGSYNRRNTYGAVISYGSAFQSERETMLLQSILKYGFCDPGVVLKQFKVFGSVSQVIIHVIPKISHRTSEFKTKLQVNCKS